MNPWNTLFATGHFTNRIPDSEVLRFLERLEREHLDGPLRIWDLCCGAGRHVAVVAARGHEVYGSDGSPDGLARTRELLEEMGLSAHLEVADMTVCPWPEARFHGVVSIDALHHNDDEGVRRALAAAHAHLVPGGLLLATLKSTKADSFGLGEEIAPRTFVRDDCLEAGVPHRFFDESEVRELLADWDLRVLVEQVMDFRQLEPDGHLDNPFRWTRWGILARRPE